MVLILERSYTVFQILEQSVNYDNAWPRPVQHGNFYIFSGLAFLLENLSFARQNWSFCRTAQVYLCKICIRFVFSGQRKPNKGPV